MNVTSNNTVTISCSSAMLVFASEKNLRQIACMKNSNVSLALIDRGFVAVQVSALQ
jgi:hypothetical protein